MGADDLACATVMRGPSGSPPLTFDFLPGGSWLLVVWGLSPVSHADASFPGTPYVDSLPDYCRRGIDPSFVRVPDDPPVTHSARLTD